MSIVLQTPSACPAVQRCFQIQRSLFDSTHKLFFLLLSDFSAPSLNEYIFGSGEVSFKFLEPFRKTKLKKKNFLNLDRQRAPTSGTVTRIVRGEQFLKCFRYTSDRLKLLQFCDTLRRIGAKNCKFDLSSKWSKW